MKIAFNAIRVSNKAGSGFDTFIINFINEFAKYVYSKPELNIVFDVYTLYPQHFPEVRKENIKQIKLPFLKQKIRNNSEQYSAKKNKILKKLLIPIYYLLSTVCSLLSSVRFALADYFRMFWTQFIFPFYAKKYNYDLIVALTEYEGMYFYSNQIIIIHNTVPFLFPQFPTKYRFYTYKLLPKIISKCEKIITVSNILKEEIIKLFKVKSEKISVIYEGIDSKIFHPASFQEVENFKKYCEIECDYVLSVGYSHPIKNFDSVFSAFSLIKNKKIKLVVAGYFNKKIELSNDIKYVGHISNDKLYILYSGAKCFVFATLHEGFGLPPLEAMACGCPVVVSNCGSLPEVCGDAAVYVNPYDPKDIADGILKVLTDENLRQQLIKKGFEQVKKFTWENSVVKFIEALKNLQNNSIK